MGAKTSVAFIFLFSIWYLLNTFSFDEFEKETYIRKTLTPSKSTKLKDVGRNIDIKDFYKSQVHVDRLKSHPSKCGQKEVVKNGSHCNTQAIVIKWSQPRVNQKEQVETQQGPWEVDKDLRWVISSQLSVEQSKGQV